MNRRMRSAPISVQPRKRSRNGIASQITGDSIVKKLTSSASPSKPKKRKLKIRLAPQRDRDHASRFAAAYRAGEMIPWGDGERPIDGDDLAFLLECFAEEGTFVPSRQVKAFTRNLLLREEIAERRAQGKSYRDARLDVMIEFEVSESTVDRAVMSSRGGTRR